MDSNENIKFVINTLLSGKIVELSSIVQIYLPQNKFNKIIKICRNLVGSGTSLLPAYIDLHSEIFSVYGFTSSSDSWFYNGKTVYLWNELD